jgi:hypothetical protein
MLLSTEGGISTTLNLTLTRPCDSGNGSLARILCDDAYRSSKQTNTGLIMPEMTTFSGLDDNRDEVHGKSVSGCTPTDMYRTSESTNTMDPMTSEATALQKKESVCKDENIDPASDDGTLTLRKTMSEDHPNDTRSDVALAECESRPGDCHDITRASLGPPCCISRPLVGTGASCGSSTSRFPF